MDPESWGYTLEFSEGHPCYLICIKPAVLLGFIAGTLDKLKVNGCEYVEW